MDKNANQDQPPISTACQGNAFEYMDVLQFLIQNCDPIALGIFQVNPSSQGASNATTDDPITAFQLLKVEKAKSYFNEVNSKLQYLNQPEVFDKFVDIMKKYTIQHRLRIKLVAKDVEELFKDYPDLITGFNDFVPSGYKIKVKANWEIDS